LVEKKSNSLFFSLSIRHLIFEYLPHKEKLEASQSPVQSTKEESNTVIDKLLGRLPIWPTQPPASPPSPPPPPASSSSNLSLNDAGLQLLNLLQQQTKKDSPNETSQNIIDRLNEAIRRASCPPRTTNADHRIAVQA